MSGCCYIPTQNRANISNSPFIESILTELIIGHYSLRTENNNL